jgi:hypothetical protein
MIRKISTGMSGQSQWRPRAILAALLLACIAIAYLLVHTPRGEIFGKIDPALGCRHRLTLSSEWKIKRDGYPTSVTGDSGRGDSLYVIKISVIRAELMIENSEAPKIPVAETVPNFMHPTTICNQRQFDKKSVLT